MGISDNVLRKFGVNTKVSLKQRLGRSVGRMKKMKQNDNSSKFKKGDIVWINDTLGKIKGTVISKKFIEIDDATEDYTPQDGSMPWSGWVYKIKLDRKNIDNTTITYLTEYEIDV